MHELPTCTNYHTTDFNYKKNTTLVMDFEVASSKRNWIPAKNILR